MSELVVLLNKAAKAYYQEDREILSNKEYDALYDELEALEKTLGIVMNNSPTVQVGYTVSSELVKERHERPMLSLDKTKSPEELQAWLGDKEGLLSWKMDGLTVVLTYDKGVLVKALTRGDGEIGEVITENAKVFSNLPARIPFEGRLIIRGEAVITYSEFRRINESIADVDARYKNPRNLCSGTVRQLNTEITAKRNVSLFAFSYVSAEGRDPGNSVEANMEWLASLGFQIVPCRRVNHENIISAIQDFAAQIRENDFPSDGLVLVYDDIAYGQSLGTTAKFPRNSIAFKWADEEAETILNEIEWSPSRTGLINPVAIFNPVELEGTTVSRASLHNLSIMDQLELGIGDHITVYKANMIIPQISDNLTRSGSYKTPDHCPACGSEPRIHDENGVRTLYCENPLCSAKKVKLFSHYVSRDAMNIDGISEMTITKMIDKGFLSELYDIYDLAAHHDEIVAMEGFGEKSFQNMTASIERSKTTSLPRFIYALGILNIGSSNAKLLCRHFANSFDRLKNAAVEEMTEIEGIGEVIAKSVRDYFDNPHNEKVIARLLPMLTFEERRPVQSSAGQENEDQAGSYGQGNEGLAGSDKQGSAGQAVPDLTGLTFVITGSVNHFKNRNEVKERIEDLGGKVTGSVSKKTDYLINNDSKSASSKNKKAKELNIPIITEEEFMEMIGLPVV